MIKKHQKLIGFLILVPALLIASAPAFGQPRYKYHPKIQRPRPKEKVIWKPAGGGPTPSAYCQQHPQECYCRRHPTSCRQPKKRY